MMVPFVLNDIDLIKKNKKGKVSTAKRADQEEIFAIKTQLGMTHEQFCEAMGIPTMRMAAYMHGRTKFIPHEVMAAARKLRATASDHIDPYFLEAVDVLQTTSLTDFLDSWKKTLGLQEDGDERIADIMGISLSTLTRWKNGPSSTRPSFLTKCIKRLHDAAAQT